MQTPNTNTMSAAEYVNKKSEMRKFNCNLWDYPWKHSHRYSL